MEGDLPSPIEKAWNFFEKVYEGAGLMEPGDANSPAKRLVATAGVTSIVVWIAKPQIMFTADGEPKNWVITNPNDPNATHLPWWMVPLLGGFFGGFLV
jgi:hypothetical protein